MKIFNYIPELDAFVCTKEYLHIAEELRLCEWTAVVWLCRLLGMDNDYMEHAFDNYEEREALEEKAKELGYDSEELLIVLPERFKDGADGPCHSDKIRKQFWTEVLKSMDLSLDFLIEVARENYQKELDLAESFRKQSSTYPLPSDIEEAIKKLRE